MPNATEQQSVAELKQAMQAFSQMVQEKDLDVGDAQQKFRESLDGYQSKLLEKISAWETIQLTRHPQRPYPQDYIRMIFTDFLELHGDRHSGDDLTILGGFAKFDGKPVMVIGTQKGRNLKQNIQFHFGSALPEGFRKALRLMRLADKARCPIITFVDTPGAYPGVGSEERNVSEAIAMNLREMFRLNVPVVCVITGEGGSGGALSMAVGNKVLMMEFAYYSVITPEGCAAILWKDVEQSEAIPKAAEALHLTAKDLLKLKIIDGIIPEPTGGAHNDAEKAAANVADALRKTLKGLDWSERKLRNQRYERFRDLGQFIKK